MGASVEQRHQTRVLALQCFGGLRVTHAGKSESASLRSAPSPPRRNTTSDYQPVESTFGVRGFNLISYSLSLSQDTPGTGTFGLLEML